MPCHTQFVEAGVKEAALVSSTSGDEKMQSVVAIMRPAIVTNFNTDAKAKVQHKNESVKGVNPNDKKRTSSILEGASAQFYQATKCPSSSAVFEFIQKKYNQFSEMRKKNFVSNALQTRQKRPNQAQLVKGVSYITHISGLIPFSHLLIAHRDRVIQELRKREINQFSVKDNITTLKKH